MIKGDLKLKTAPLVEPVRLNELELHLRDSVEEDKDLLKSLISTSRALFERFTGMALIEQTWEIAFPGFGATLPLRRAPVRSVTSVKYYDSAGTLQTLAPDQYRLNDHSRIPTLTPAYGVSWPSTELDRPDAVIVEFVAGVYTTQNNDTIDKETDPQVHYVDKFLMGQQAIKVLAQHLHENPEMVKPVQLIETPMHFQMMVDICRIEYF